MSEYDGGIPPGQLQVEGRIRQFFFDTRHKGTTGLTYHVQAAKSPHPPKILTHGWQVNEPVVVPHRAAVQRASDGFDRPGCDLVGDAFAGVNDTFSAAAGNEIKGFIAGGFELLLLRLTFPRQPFSEQILLPRGMAQ